MGRTPARRIAPRRNPLPQRRRHPLHRPPLADYFNSLLAVSGDQVRPAVVRSVRRLAASKRLIAHKSARSTRGRGLVVTGSFVGRGGVAPTNAAHLKMKDSLAELQHAGKPEAQLKATRSLIGRTNYFLHLYRLNPKMAERLRSRLAWLHNVRRLAERGELQRSTSEPEWTGPPPWEQQEAV